MSPTEALEHAKLVVAEKAETLRLASIGAKESRVGLLDAVGNLKHAEADHIRADIADDAAQHRVSMAQRELGEAHRALHDLVCGCGKAPTPQAAETKPALN